MMLIGLASLAAISAAFVAQSAVALRTNDEEVQTEALIIASLELTAYQVTAAAADKRPTHGTFDFQLGGADIAVEFKSETARIDLNAAPKPLIAGLFAALGAEGRAADGYADRVIAWRTPPKENEPDGEDALYRAAGLTYSPRRSLFRHVDELWLVFGLPPGLVERALPFVTVYSGVSDINVLDAEPEVIAALPGMSSPRLNSFLAQREKFSADPQLLAGALGDKQPGATTKGSNAYRIWTGIAYGNGLRNRSEVVIVLTSGNGKQPYAVLSWRSDSDGG
jgi:general secretion pathway protein K